MQERLLFSSRSPFLSYEQSPQAAAIAQSFGTSSVPNDINSFISFSPRHVIYTPDEEKTRLENLPEMW